MATCNAYSGFFPLTRFCPCDSDTWSPCRYSLTSSSDPAATDKGCEIWDVGCPAGLAQTRSVPLKLVAPAFSERLKSSSSPALRHSLPDPAVWFRCHGNLVHLSVQFASSRSGVLAALLCCCCSCKRVVRAAPKSEWDRSS